jgi:hypothetical protein
VKGMRTVLGIWMAVACLVVWAPRGAALAEQGAYRDRLDEHFTRARADLTVGRHRAARKELGRAARQLEKKVYPASGEVKQALVKQAVALKSLSAEVDRGHVTDPREIDVSAARAHAALAKYHQMRAEQRWSDEESRDAGRELGAAAHHLERGAVWLGHGSDTLVRTATRDAGVLSGQLVEGRYVPEQVDDGIQAVGREIDRLGWRPEPRQGRQAPARPR